MGARGRSGAGQPREGVRTWCVDAGQVVATLAAGWRLLDVVTRPELHGRLLRSEVFDLAGVFHGYHRGRGRGGASDAEMMGGCSVGDSLTKIGTKSGVHALLLLFCARGGAWGLGWADAGGFFDANAPPGARASATAPPGLLGVAGSALVLRLAFFYARFRLYKARKAQAPGRSKALGLHAAGIPLFDGADPRFLAALSERLVACEYGPGDLIIEAGEKEQVPRSLTYTATLLYLSPSLSCSILLYLALSCSIALSPTRPTSTTCSPYARPHRTNAGARGCRCCTSSSRASPARRPPSRGPSPPATFPLYESPPLSRDSTCT